MWFYGIYGKNFIKKKITVKYGKKIPSSYRKRLQIDKKNMANMYFFKNLTNGWFCKIIGASSENTLHLDHIQYIWAVIKCSLKDECL